MGRLFYEPVDKKLLYDLLEQICHKHKNFYIVNILSYKVYAPYSKTSPNFRVE